jgi:transcription antitermination factor NusG
VIDGKRATMSDTDIQSVKRIEKALRNPAALGLPFQPGDKVRIVDGPFRDLCGRILRMNNAERIELLMHMLGSEARVWVAARQIAVD